MFMSFVLSMRMRARYHKNLNFKTQHKMVKIKLSEELTHPDYNKYIAKCGISKTAKFQSRY